MNVSTPRIPFDLLRQIIEDLDGDKPSLCSISLTSTTLRQEGQRILFQNVTSLTKVKPHIKFLQTIAASPTCLALLVRAYRQAFSHNTLEETLSAADRHDLQRPQFANMTHNALKVMHNLKELEYYPNVQGSLSASLFDGCTFTLERFDSTYTNDFVNFVDQFLPRHQNLKHLGICFARSPLPGRLQDTLPTLCPQLASLSGNWDTFATFLPGRNVTKLAWLPFPVYKDPSEMDIKVLAPAFSRIETLSYVHPQWSRLPWTLLLDSLQSVTVLEAKNYFQFDIEPPPDESDQYLDLLPRLPALHTFILSWGPQPGPVTEPPDERNRVLRRLFKVSKTLQCIEMQTDSKPARYFRITRGQDIVREADPREVRRYWVSGWL